MRQAIVYWMLVFTSMTMELRNQFFPSSISRGIKLAIMLY